MLSFAGRTAIITGASGALGRQYALDLAKRGCNVVLNDLPAASVQLEELAKKVKESGGHAVTNTDNIVKVGGGKIVEAATKAFGGAHILINNAGNLRDKSFGKMTLEEWESVIDVHLNGTFTLCHAVWPSFMQQQYGRIINIGSGAGLYGNFGQANYSSAKMGILGLTNTLAKEGQKHNISVNCVVPVARSPMTENLMSPEVLKLLEPSMAAPIVTVLAHDTHTGSGECFEVGGGWFSKVRIQRSAGAYFEGADLKAESVMAKLDQIKDFSASTYPQTAADAMQAMLAAKMTAAQRKADSAAAKAAIAHGVHSGASAASAPSSTPKPAAAPAAAPAADEQTNYPSLTSDSKFLGMQQFIEADDKRALELAATVKGNILLELTANSTVQKRWLINMKGDVPPSVRTISKADAAAVKAHVTLVCEDKTIAQLFDGSLSPEFAYMKGALKIQGQMAVAMKFKKLLETYKAMNKAGGGGH